MTKPNNEIEAEDKRTKEIFAVAEEMRDDFNEVLEKLLARGQNQRMGYVIGLGDWVTSCQSKKLKRVSGFSKFLKLRSR